MPILKDDEGWRLVVLLLKDDEEKGSRHFLANVSSSFVLTVEGIVIVGSETHPRNAHPRHMNLLRKNSKALLELGSSSTVW